MIIRKSEAGKRSVNTYLDALHLASIELLRGLEQAVELASYDLRMVEAARRLAIPLYPL